MVASFEWILYPTLQTGIPFLAKRWPVSRSNAPRFYFPEIQNYSRILEQWMVFPLRHPFVVNATAPWQMSAATAHVFWEISKLDQTEDVI